MEIKITKRQLLKTGMFNWEFWKISGRIYNDDKTKYRKFRFVVDFDANDICSYFDCDSYTKKQHDEYLDEAVCGVICYINDFDDTKEFHKECNRTIHSYNERNKPANSYYY